MSNPEYLTAQSSQQSDPSDSWHSVRVPEYEYVVRLTEIVERANTLSVHPSWIIASLVSLCYYTWANNNASMENAERHIAEVSTGYGYAYSHFFAGYPMFG